MTPFVEDFFRVFFRVFLKVQEILALRADLREICNFSADLASNLSKLRFFGAERLILVRLSLSYIVTDRWHIFCHRPMHRPPLPMVSTDASAFSVQNMLDILTKYTVKK